MSRDVPAAPSSSWVRAVYLGSLMLAGESIYLLPYMRKTFQSSMEEVFGVTSTELGTLNAMFGVVALLCYFPGGWLSDRLPARYLLSFSLVATGLGGFAMMGFPDYRGLLVVHAFWGITSILMFWAALIKATRLWGLPEEQGRAFGLLDGGRGVVAALLASLATALFMMGDSTEVKLRQVLWVYSLAPIVAGALVWQVVPAELPQGSVATYERMSPEGSTKPRVKDAAKRPQVWLLAVVISSAYWLYLGSFEFPAYAERVHGETKEFGAVLGTFRDWLRPVAAIGAGFLADRFRSSRVTAAAFVLLTGAYASLSLDRGGGIMFLGMQVSVVAVASFALRGIYYSLLEEGSVPRHLTGITVGIVSVVGYMPDAFAFVLSGWFTGGADPDAGYRAYFGLLAVVALFGLVATVGIARRRVHGVG